MPRFRAIVRRALLAGAAAILLVAPARAAAAPDFAISPGGTTRGLGQSLGLDFRSGILRAAWGDDSAGLSGNPDPQSSELAFARAAVGADGSVTVGGTVNASRAPGNQAGASLAVNPTNPQNLVAVSDGQEATCCRGATFRAWSFDGGTTWQGTTDLPSGINGGGPQVAFDSFGNAFVAVIDQTVFDRPTLRVYLSVDGGVTFSELPLPASTELDAAPALAVGQGTVWVAFTRYDGVALVATAAARVTGLGQVGPFTIQKAAGSGFARLPDISLGPNGEALVVYESRPVNGFDAVRAQLDADGVGPGGFGPPSTVANIAAYGSEALPDVAYDAGGTAHVVYRDQELRPSTQDVLLQFTDDDGVTWSAAQRVNDDVASTTRRVPGVTTEVGGTRLAVAWFDERDGSFRLRGRILAGVQAPATPVSPVDLAAVAVSQTRIDLAWVDRSGNESGFEITRTGGGSTRVLAAGANITTFSDTGLTESTEYTYVVRAVNSAGASTSTNQAVAKTLATPPPAPTNLTAVGGGFSRIDLAWTASARADGYHVFQSTDGVQFAQVTTSFTNSAMIFGLEPGVTYFFKVRAFNSGGISGFSNVASSTTQLAAPTAPSGLTAIATSSSSIRLAWSDRSSNEDRFEVEESRNGKSFRRVASVNPNTTSLTRFGLRAGRTYSYRVRACNSAGCSAYTNVASATTPR
jgi:fibronectin type 3 domain-containing protein